MRGFLAAFAVLARYREDAREEPMTEAGFHRVGLGDAQDEALLGRAIVAAEDVVEAGPVPGPPSLRDDVPLISL